MPEQRQEAVLVLDRLVDRPVRVDSHSELLLEGCDVARGDVVGLNDADCATVREVVKHATDESRWDHLIAVEDHEVVVRGGSQEVVQVSRLEPLAIGSAHYLHPVGVGELVDLRDVLGLVAVVEDDGSEIAVVLRHRLGQRAAVEVVPGAVHQDDMRLVHQPESRDWTESALHDQVVPGRVEHVLGAVEPEVADEGQSDGRENTSDRCRAHQVPDLSVGRQDGAAEHQQPNRHDCQVQLGGLRHNSILLLDACARALTQTDQEQADCHQSETDRQVETDVGTGKGENSRHTSNSRA